MTTQRLSRDILETIGKNEVSEHAVRKNQDATTITFEAARDAKGVRLSVRDDGSNGTEFPAETKTTVTGIGLSNVQNRLESAFGNNYQFSIRRSNAGFYVDIFINERRHAFQVN